MLGLAKRRSSTAYGSSGRRQDRDDHSASDGPTPRIVIRRRATTFSEARGAILASNFADSRLELGERHGQHLIPSLFLAQPRTTRRVSAICLKHIFPRLRPTVMLSDIIVCFCGVLHTFCRVLHTHIGTTMTYEGDHIICASWHQTARYLGNIGSKTTQTHPDCGISASIAHDMQIGIMDCLTQEARSDTQEEVRRMRMR